jgi:hypothetical protein
VFLIYAFKDDVLAYFSEASNYQEDYIVLDYCFFEEAAAFFLVFVFSSEHSEVLELFI